MRSTKLTGKTFVFPVFHFQKGSTEARLDSSGFPPCPDYLKGLCFLRGSHKATDHEEETSCFIC